MGPLAALFLGGKVRPVILLDGDQAGHGKFKSLTKELYKNHEAAVMLLPDILGINGAEIEDLLGEEIILSALSPLLSTKLQLTKDDRTVNGGVVMHIETAAKRLGIDLPQGWKADCAYSLTATWSQKTKDTIPVEVLDRAAILFSAIGKCFADSQLMKVA